MPAKNKPPASAAVSTSQIVSSTKLSSTSDDSPISTAPPLHTLPPRRDISQLENFAMSALAPSMAVIFTLPFDTVKVRMQLQGEIQAVKDSSTGKTLNRRVAGKVYKNSLDCLYKTYKYEGLKGLEKGLTPSILKESSKNVFRLGLYDPILKVIHPTDDNTSSSSAPAWKRMVSGGLCGALGAVSANPFELVKTRLQSSAAGAIAVGNQYNYSGVFSALRHIMSEEGGVKGLYRGSWISVGRGVLGSAANLSSFTLLKDEALQNGYSDGAPLDMVCSLASALISVLFMNPLDVVRTRLYNAKPTAPSSHQKISFTIGSIVRNEGWATLYRGFGTHFMRIGPHFCLTFVFLEELKRSVKKIHQENHETFLAKMKMNF